MPPPADDRVEQLLRASSIDPHDYDKHRRVLRGVLRGKGLAPSDVLAVSVTTFRLVVVCAKCIVFASEKGLVTKRVEIERVVPYSGIANLLQEEGGYKDRRESTLEAVDGNSKQVFQLKWEGWTRDGSVSATNAAGERDRILNTMLHAMGTT